MRTKGLQFMVRVAAVVAFITSFLLGDAALAGQLSLAGGFILIPAAMLVTGRLVSLSLKPVRKTRRAYTAQPAARRAAHTPYLAVANGTHTQPPRPAA